MKYPTEDDWVAWGITERCHKLFLLRWRELLDHRTADTWQLRTRNLKGVLLEVQVAAQRSLIYKRYQHNFQPLIGELIHVAKNDRIVRDEFPLILPGIEFLQKVYKNKPKDFQTIENLAQVVHSQLDDYQQVLVRRLRTLIQDSDADTIGDIYSLTKALATEFSCSGIAVPFLQNALAILSDPTAGEFVNRYDRVIQACLPGKSEFDCLFALEGSGVPDENSFGTPGITFTSKDPEEELSQKQTEFYDQAPSDTQFLKVTVQARDPWSARQAAEQQAANLFACLKFYRRSTTLSIRRVGVLVTAKQDGETHIVGTEELRLSPAQSGGFPSRQITRILDLHRFLPQGKVDPLTSALQYHRIALSATTDEARLVNLWIALECIIRQASGDTIIGRATTFVPPSVSLTKPLNLVRSFAVDIRYYWRVQDASALWPHLPNSSATRCRAEDLLRLLLPSADAGGLAALREFLEPHPLLSHRLSVLRELFANPARLGDEIEAHKQNIAWELRRIYRERNDVMHSGLSSELTSHLLQHLHTYFILAVHNLVHDLRTQKANSIPGALEHRRLLFRHFVTLLKNRDQHVTLTGVLYPDFILSRSDDPPAWP